ncbi:MAG: uracil-DNA glycosylase [Actinobacteria bacterium]|nr:uracil-DNA glycosylase [Actinomycetota bacterium]
MKDWTTLLEYCKEISGCQKCDLARSRTNFVFGSGSQNAELIFIGEAPGYNEDIQGKPFVGAAGKLLDSLLNEIGLSRDEVFIANVLKCRPPDNRDPRKEEIELCKDYLFRQIEIIDPQLICTLGRHSTSLLLKTEQPISKLRGNKFIVDGRIVLPIFHPAAALYTASNLQVIKSDFQRIKRILSGEEKEDASFILEKESIPPAKVEEKEKSSDQLGLF